MTIHPHRKDKLSRAGGAKQVFFNVFHLQILLKQFHMHSWRTNLRDIDLFTSINGTELTK